MNEAKRQTASFLRQRFDQAGIRPVTRYGQNFLTDLNLVELLARTGNVEKRDVVLEVGTGTGGLTNLIAPDAAHVVTVEIDPQLFVLAREELRDRDNVTMLKVDALRNKNNFSREVLDAIAEQLAVDSQRRLKLVANLPYNIATPVISNLMRTEFTPAAMSVTIQKELGDRIVAAPNNKDYGALSAWLQSQCRVELVRVMPPQVFWPRPKVHSAIVYIETDLARRQAIPDLDFWHAFGRGAFLHRRKFLRSCLLSAYKGQLDKPTVDQIMQSQQIEANARTEQLSVPRLLALCEAVREAVQKPTAT
jgi:16S rRNA (adenine1518-N6/adenine1519-N6)-dimethyltransferase